MAQVSVLRILTTHIIATFYITSVQLTDCPEPLRWLCRLQQNCGDCMLAHSCCNWCYGKQDIVYSCDFNDSFSQCTDLESNKISSAKIVQNLQFTEIESAQTSSSAIQLRPQSVNLVLRKDEPVNFTFSYKAAKNYPLELYFLADLSYSMKNHLDTLKNLGDRLPKSLQQLTKYYKLAFGSFLDKPGMPYILTDPMKVDNPCTSDDGQCDPTYLFKHSMNFTDDISQFFQQVRDSKVSANMDDLDGALEAIYQILVCDEIFGWSNYARKIILLSTDSLLHIEGDGILAGASEVNIHELCLVNSTGDHTQPLKYDFPSLGTIKRLLRRQKTNLIVAVTQDKIETYKRMKQDILLQESFVGELQNNSGNILELVKAGFNQFIRNVHFSVNNSNSPGLDIKFFGDCYNTGHFIETAGCDNVEEEQEINFIAQFTLVKSNLNEYVKYIFIKENNINEEIEVRTEYISGVCQCPNEHSAITCDNGIVNCGRCVCDLGWTGPECSEECLEDLQSCRKDKNSLSCSSRGDCECGKCICPEPYVGPFCEYECPLSSKNHLICSGKGTCLAGDCLCSPGYSGTDCSCDDGTTNCRLESKGPLCSDRGNCTCNKCECSNDYTGTYCEMNNNQKVNLFCDKYETAVKNHFVPNNSGEVPAEAGNYVFQFEEGETPDDNNCGEQTCSTVYYTNETQRCIVKYCYHAGDNNIVHLMAFGKTCSITSQAMGTGLAIAAFVAVVVGGIIAILGRKISIYKAEKAEYKKFAAANSEFKEQNPLYVSPISKYENPMRQQRLNSSTSKL